MLEELIDKIKEAADGDYNWSPGQYDLPEDVDYVDEEIIDELRWQSVIRTIVQYNGHLFAIEWLQGLTENQENEFDADDPVVYPVERREKIVYTYKRI